MINLESEVLELGNFIFDADLIDIKISKREIAWHIDHCLRVTSGIITILEKSNPADFKSNFNLKRFLVLSLKTIPRGKGRAPKEVNNEGKIEVSDLEVLLQKALVQVGKIDSLPEKSNFVHPYFGQLKAKQSIKFISLHNKHHIKIIKEIYKSKKS